MDGGLDVTSIQISMLLLTVSSEDRSPPSPIEKLFKDAKKEFGEILISCYDFVFF